MRTLVVVESMFGNTRQIADAVAGGLSSFGPVDVVEVHDAPAAVREDVDLLVVGGPTHAFGMTRASTRKDAVTQGARGSGSADVGIREWLESLPSTDGRAAAAFDTRVTKVRRLPGAAARGAAKALRRHGYRLVLGPESFYVEDTPGPLIADELDRARRWGDRLGAAATRAAAGSAGTGEGYAARTLLAEDLLLLLTDDDTGKLAASSAEVDVALGGALLVELTLTERVDVAGPGEREREGRLVVRDPGPTGDVLLDEALATVGQKQGKKPQSVVGPLGKRTRVRLYERLAEAGLVRAEEGRVLGVFPSHRWPSEDAGHEAAVRTGLLTALRDGMTTDARTGALISLLVALNAVHKAVDPDSVGLSKREMKANAKRVAEGDWAAKAVRQAIDSMNAAVIAATAVVVGGSGGSGSS
jgi:hypothetical protein